MHIRIYDTKQRQKVPLEPITPGHIGIYVCGPTVYDYSHVGHARVYVAFDVIVRYLRAAGLSVKYVRNVTDVDDKIINRANEQGRGALEVSADYTAAYDEDMERLGNLPPDVQPLVSTHMPQIIELVQRLIDSGKAYVVGQDNDNKDVYYAVDQFAPYGCLSGRNLDDLQAGARVEVDERKRNPLDFALWKSAKVGEPTWDSPWGAGRPGWHIECSAMSRTHLGTRFDLHGGGMDLIFPHHENELAQSQGADGLDSFARYWLHNGFVNIRSGEGADEKMSKSLGNFFTIRTVLQHHEPEALRLYLLGTHYRNPISFEVQVTEDGAVRFTGVDEAETRLAYIYRTIAKLDELAPTSGDPIAPNDLATPADKFEENFAAAMDDDFNTAAALGHIAELVSLANRLIDQAKSVPKNQRLPTLRYINAALKKMGQVLGTFNQVPQEFLQRRKAKLCAQRNIDPAHIEKLLSDRNSARAAKEFAQADLIRQQLTDMGIDVMDGASGSRWDIL